MTLITLIVCICTYLDFAVAMVRFFHRPERRQALTAWVALAGILSFLWQAWGVWNTEGVIWRTAAGCIQYLLAWALFRWALASLGQRRLTAVGQPDLPEFVHRRGPYGWLRHPLYVAYTLAWIAGWTVTGDPLQLIPAVVMGASYLHAAHREEEKFERSSHANEYACYRREVGGFFPLLTKCHIPSRGRD